RHTRRRSHHATDFYPAVRFAGAIAARVTETEVLRASIFFTSKSRNAPLAISFSGAASLQRRISLRRARNRAFGVEFSYSACRAPDSPEVLEAVSEADGEGIQVAFPGGLLVTGFDEALPFGAKRKPVPDRVDCACAEEKVGLAVGTGVDRYA